MDLTNHSNHPQDHAQGRQKALVGLLLKHQRSMFAYIYSLMPHKADADDILQETCLTIHEKFDDFELNTNFLLWANRIAYWKIKEARQKYARSKVIFNDDTLELVAKSADCSLTEDNLRHEALANCLQKLKDRDRQMILARYEPDGGAEQAARVSDRTLVATYKALARIRQILFQCVNKQVRFERSLTS